MGYREEEGVGELGSLCMQIRRSQRERSRRRRHFVGLRWGQLFCSLKDVSKPMPETETGLGIEASLFGLPGFRFSVAGLVRPVFNLRRCDRATGFGRAIKLTRPSATKAWYNYSIDVRVLAQVIVKN